MIITLPQDYSYRDIADVYDGILYIHQLDSFRSLMFDITYKNIKDTYTCRYCGRKVDRKTSTLDHIYPVHLGGPYIPENLDISCSKCNCLKKDMLEKDFIYFLGLSPLEQCKYQKEYSEKTIYSLKKSTPVIPSDWYTYMDLDKIGIIQDSKNARKQLEKIRSFYSEFHRLQTPLIVDRNYLLLEGYFETVVAKENSLRKVPVIVLENVILEY